MRPARVQDCNAADARARYTAAAKFLEVAQLLVDETEPDFVNVAASLAVLAGIAASDSACCKTLGYRPRGENHFEAVKVLAQVAGGGKEASEALRRLISLKDSAQYGVFTLGRAQLKIAMRQAERLLDFAQATLNRQ